MNPWGERLLLASFIAILFLRDLGQRDLWASHEARAAQNAQRMLDDGDWGLPRLFDDQADFQKPPGYYWLTALTAEALRGGTVEGWAVRLPAAVSALITVGLIFVFLRRSGRSLAAIIAALVLATAVHFTAIARTGRIDMPLTTAVTVAMLLGWRAAIAGERPTRARSAGLGLALGVGLLLKGLIAVALPMAALGVVWLTESRQRLPWSRLALAVGVMLAVALPWYCWANAATDGEFFRVFFVYHHFNRAFGGASALAGHPWWYYLPRFAIDFLPWTPVLLVALVAAFRSRLCCHDPIARFGINWFVVMLVVLSCSRFKRADYLLPAYPGAAIFLGCIVERWLMAISIQRRRLLLQALLPAILACIVGGWWLFEGHIAPQQEARHEQREFATAIRAQAPQPQEVLLFRVESHLLAYHLRRPLHTLVEWGE